MRISEHIEKCLPDCMAMHVSGQQRAKITSVQFNFLGSKSWILIKVNICDYYVVLPSATYNVSNSGVPLKIPSGSSLSSLKLRFLGCYRGVGNHGQANKGGQNDLLWSVQHERIT